MVNADSKEVSKEEELYHYRGEYEVKLSSDIYLEEMKKPKVPSIDTGIFLLDELIGGVIPGELITISGWTGGGKTTLARTFTKNFHIQNVMSCWFQFEETYNQFLGKFRASNIKELPVFSLPQKLKAHSMEWYEERVHEAVLKYGVKVIFIDHLHRLLDSELRSSAILRSGSSNISTFVGGNVMEIKAISLRYNIITCMIAHTKKTASAGSKDILGLGSVRDSSFIEQESDTVMYVWRAKQKNGANLKIAKARESGADEKIIWLRHRPETKDFVQHEMQPKEKTFGMED